MEKLLGKWIQKPGQPYEGLWFLFKDDSTYEAKYEPMGIVSGGTFTIEGDHINMLQTVHTLGFTGEFKGLFEINNDELIMALTSAADQERPEDLSDARIYQKVQD